MKYTPVTIYVDCEVRGVIHFCTALNQSAREVHSKYRKCTAHNDIAIRWSVSRRLCMCCTLSNSLLCKSWSLCEHLFSPHCGMLASIGQPFEWTYRAFQWICNPTFTIPKRMPLLNEQGYKNCWKWEPCCPLHNTIFFRKFWKPFWSISGVTAQISAVIRSFSSFTESIAVRKTQFLRWLHRK